MKAKAKKLEIKVKNQDDSKHIAKREKRIKRTADETEQINKQKRQHKVKEVRILLNRIEIAKKNRRTMAEFIKPTTTLKFEGNLSENWRCFKRDFNIFLVAAELTRKTDLVKINLFLNAAGPEAVEVYESLNLSDGQRENFDEIIRAFEAFCNQRKNTVYERFLFYQRKQREGESFDSFLTDIMKLGKNCEFGAVSDEMLRDRIVMGVSDTKLQAKLLETSNLTHTMAIDKSRANEVTKAQTTNMNDTSAIVNEIRSTQSNSGNRWNQQREQWNNNNGQRSSNGRAQHTPIRQQQQRNTNNTNMQNNNSISGRSNNTNTSDFF